MVNLTGRCINIEELKSLQVDMLIKIDEFCKNNQIRYSLDYGTLIGAIRHEGYIPWDDDIDITMPRPDYNRFIHSFSGAYDNLNVVAPELNWNHFETYANVYDNRTILIESQNPHNGIEIGIKIDIFPIDGVPSDEHKYINLIKKIKRLNWIRGYKKIAYKDILSFYKESPRRIIGQILQLPYFFSTYTDIQKLIWRECANYDYHNCEYLDKVVFHPYPRTIMKKEVVENYISIKFEGHQFSAFALYDMYLRMIYGDYMKLPPIEQRQNKHGFKAYWKDC